MNADKLVNQDDVHNVIPLIFKELTSIVKFPATISCFIEACNIFRSFSDNITSHYHINTDSVQGSNSKTITYELITTQVSIKTI